MVKTNAKKKQILAKANIEEPELTTADLRRQPISSGLSISDQPPRIYIPDRRFLISPEYHQVKIIHESGDLKIGIHRIKWRGKWTSKSLVKFQSFKKKTETIIFRGFKLEDLLILKRNWNKILKEMVS